MSFEVVGICLGKLLEGSLNVLGAGKGEQTKHLYEFGPFRLDSDERLLMRGAEVVQVMPKAFDLLLALVENPGHLQEKEELLRRVWPDTFVEEANLSSNISLIRTDCIFQTASFFTLTYSVDEAYSEKYSGLMRNPG